MNTTSLHLPNGKTFHEEGRDLLPKCHPRGYQHAPWVITNEPPNCISCRNAHREREPTVPMYPRINVRTAAMIRRVALEEGLRPTVLASRILEDWATARDGP